MCTATWPQIILKTLVFPGSIQANKTVPPSFPPMKMGISGISEHRQCPIATHPDYLQQQLEEMKNLPSLSALDITESSHQYIYYQHSKLYAQLRLYPIVQLVIFAAFLFTAYIFFNTSRRSEQNRVWVEWRKKQPTSWEHRFRPWWPGSNT